MPISCASLLLASTFSVGHGPVDGSLLGRLTEDERCAISQYDGQYEACDNQTCRERILGQMLRVVELRRRLRRTTGSAHLFNQIRRPCDQASSIDAQLECFTSTENITFEDAMAMAGYTTAGVTYDGYAQLSMQMTMDEVEYILGGPGEETAYASSGGYSSATYIWRAGRRAIVLSFSNAHLSARAQIGLQ